MLHLAPSPYRGIAFQESLARLRPSGACMNMGHQIWGINLQNIRNQFKTLTNRARLLANLPNPSSLLRKPCLREIYFRLRSS